MAVRSRWEKAGERIEKETNHAVVLYVLRLKPSTCPSFKDGLGTICLHCFYLEDKIPFSVNHKQFLVLSEGLEWENKNQKGQFISNLFIRKWMLKLLQT